MSEKRSQGSGSSEIKAVSSTLELILTLEQEGEKTATDLAEILDRSVSSVHSHLKTLERQGFIVQNGYKYRPGLRFFEIGEKVRRGYVDIYQSGAEVADKLAAETDEFVWLATEEQNKSVYIYKTSGEKGIESGAYQLGSRWPLHTTAAGKAILSQKDDEMIRELIDQHGLPATTENTITDRSELFDELETVRAEGVAFDDEESAVGLRAVSAPVEGFDEYIGAVAISGPVSRMQESRFRREIPERLRKASNIISIKYRNGKGVKEIND